MNIIEKNDILYGFSEDLIKHLKNEINRLLEEEIEAYYFEEIADLIYQLKKEDTETLLRIEAHPMGGYSIKKWEY